MPNPTPRLLPYSNTPPEGIRDATDIEIIDADRAEILLTLRDTILDVAASLASQGVDGIQPHLDAITLAQGLIWRHDSNNEPDELPRYAAEQLLLYHLDALDSFNVPL